MSLTRRETLGAIALIGVAGCTGSNSDGDDEATEEDPVELGAGGGGISLVSHRFEVDAELGPILFTTVRNTRDAPISLGDLTCRVYDGETLIAETYATISMSPNETKEFDLSFPIGVKTDDLQSSTRYEIIVDVPYDNGATDETERKFNQPVRFIGSTNKETRSDGESSN